MPLACLERLLSARQTYSKTRTHVALAPACFSCFLPRHTEGIENVWARHRTLAAAVHAAIDRWSSDGGVLRANIEEAPERSVAVTTVAAP